MEYSEDDYLMISGIQHFKFCRRQWALIHIEQQWAENVHTVTGELMHKKCMILRLEKSERTSSLSEPCQSHPESWESAENVIW